jgi:nucleoside-diphosphate-sugar epimerase
MELYRSEGFPLVIVRPAIVLGAGGPVMHLGVANWFGLGRCQFWGRGENLLPAILVEDVVKALIATIDAEGIEGKVYNLSAEPCFSARQYVAEVESVLGIKIATSTSSARRSFIGDSVKWVGKLLARHPDRARIPSIRDWQCREQQASFDTSAAQQDLNWMPENDPEKILEKGVREPARAAL